jgi:hypothetical protein
MWKRAALLTVILIVASGSPAGAAVEVVATDANERDPAASTTHMPGQS